MTRPVRNGAGRGAALAVVTLLVLGGTSGCALLFDLAAGAQRNDCNRLPDARAQADCRERVDRQTEAARAERDRAK